MVRLSEGEACALCDVLNSTYVDAHGAGMLWLEVEDALEDGLAEKWGIDGPALVEKLKHMPRARLMAIADAVERWWVLIDEEPDLSWAASLGRVGLLREAGLPDPEAPG